VVFITSGHLLQIWINIFDLPNIQIPRGRGAGAREVVAMVVDVAWLPEGVAGGTGARTRRRQSKPHGYSCHGDTRRRWGGLATVRILRR
jgi:hypothetical protein